MFTRRGPTPITTLPAPASRVEELEDAMRAMHRANYYASEGIISNEEAQSLVFAEFLRVMGEPLR